MNRSEDLDVNENVVFSIPNFPFYALVSELDETYSEVNIQDNGGVVYTALVDAVSAEADAKQALFNFYKSGVAFNTAA